MSQKFENNLSQGSVVKKLILFSIPFLLSNLLQSIYNVADMIIVGQFAGTYSMSGVNIGGQISFLITNMVFGLTVGATVLIGQYLGANDRTALKETIGTLFTTLLVLAAVLTVLMIALAEPFLKLIRTPQESFSEAKIYFIISMLGTIFIFGYNALSAVMRGMGDSKNPLYFVAIACSVNIVLDLLLVGALKLGAAGAAAATVASQAISMILCIIYLKKNDFIFDFHPSSFRFHKERLKMLMKIGIPNSVQNMTSSISFLFLTTLTNTIGVTASAAVGAVGKFNGFAILPAVAMSSSISAMSAQNLGAGEEKRAVKTLQVGMIIALAISCIIFLLTLFFPEDIMRIFGDDPALIKEGVTYIFPFSFDYLLVPFFFSLNGLFIGSGHTTFSLINGVLSSILIRIPTAFFFGMVLDMGLTGIGMAAPVATLFSTIIGVIYFCSGKWKKMVIIKDRA